MRARTAVEEALARIAAFEARSARLQAEMNEAKAIDFAPDVRKNTEVVEREGELFLADRTAFEENAANLEQQLGLANKELELVEPILRTGASNEVEVLKLRREVEAFTTKISATRSQYDVALRGGPRPLLKIRDGRANQLRRTVIASPAHGTVKDIRVTTIGGVVGAGGILMETVPRHGEDNGVRIVGLWRAPGQGSTGLARHH